MGQLTGEAHRSAEAHLSNCQTCRERVAEVRANLQVAHRVAAQAVESSPPVEAPRAYPATETDALEPEPRTIASVDIPGYEILRELHRGGQGVVYQAVQQSAKRKVAVKVLREGPYATKSARSRFEREIELVAQLKHANIVAIFDSGITPDGWHYCAMDYIRGLPFHQHVRENHLTLEQALKIFCEVCDAVQYAHHKGVIHRDLKPSNIMVNSEGNPKILDFGLAKQLIGPVETVVSMTHDIVGTLPYMSPEQAKGNPDHIDTRTDIYALGVVLYEILTGHYPYPVVGHMADVLRNITETPPTPPSRQWTPDSGVTSRSGKHIRAGHCPIDDELQTVILKTLTKERERRYQSAGDLARDIQHYLAGEPIEAKRDSALYVIRKSLRRHKFGATVVALVLVLGLAFAGYAYEQRRFQERQEDLQHLLTEGREFDARGQRLKAVAKYDEALRIAPELYEAVALKAYSLKEQYFEKGLKSPDHSLLRDSLQCCDRALQLRPERPGLLNLRCELHRELGDLSAAEESCRQALQADAAYYPASSNLARILAAQYRFDEALQVVRAALPYAVHQAEEGAIQQYDDEFWRTAGTLQLHLQDAQAIDSLRRARDIDRKDARNRLMLARAYLTLPAHLDERQALRCAISAGETRLLENPHYERIEAQAQLVSGQFAEAASSAQRAIQGGDEPAYGHLIWATAEARLGQLEEARKHLQQATTAWPQDFQDGVIVSVEKDLLWFDTLAELEELRLFAEQAIANDSEN